MEAEFGSGEGVTVTNNYTGSAGTHFASYTNLSPSNNFRLLSSDTTFKDKGVDLSSYNITTDKGGCPRPYGPASDIGAHGIIHLSRRL
jgi:hypothetical protein